MELAPGTMVNANVRLVELLGTGGMGSVWLAEHLGLDARVAVKFISPALVRADPSLAERFKREASICARIKSVHVVQTFDHGVMKDGRPYIVMELLEGCTLTELIESRGPLELRRVGMVVAQVAKVLHRAHVLSIVHRDIKPDNIFVTDSDYEMFLKVLDFGIAKQVRVGDKNEPVTKTGAVVGTLEFMSPEQAISSKNIDHRSDLFSLAVVAYYAVTGELPYDPNAAEPLWLQMTSGKSMPPSLHRPELRPEVDRWFERALRPRPDDRFQSARDMAEALRLVIAAQGLGGADGLGSGIDDSLSLASEALGMREDSVSIPAAKIGPVEDSSLFFAPRPRPLDEDDSQPAMYDLLGPDSEGAPNEVTVLMNAADHRHAETEAEGPPTEPRPRLRFSPSSSFARPPRAAVYHAVRSGVYNAGLDGAYNAEVARPAGGGAASTAREQGVSGIVPATPALGSAPAARAGTPTAHTGPTTGISPTPGAPTAISPAGSAATGEPETPPWALALSQRGGVRRWWPALVVVVAVAASALLVWLLAR